MGRLYLLLLALTASKVTGVFKTPICIELDEPLTMSVNGPHRIVMQGQLTSNAWIGINLVDGGSDICSKTLHLSANILLHMVPRIGQGHIVRNTWILNDTSICLRPDACKLEWGPEETAGGLPLTVGVLFEIVIICETNYFQIYIDGKHFASYAYRIPIERATHLVVHGAATFKKLEITKPQVYEATSTDSEWDRCTTINHININ